MAKTPPTDSRGLDLAYAVHTATCTYLLDDGGVCRWIVSPRGVVPTHVLRAIGAQFVACIDVAEPGGLVGDLRPGCTALFVLSEETRMVLLRTAAIDRVDDRRSNESEGPAHAESRPRPSVAPEASALSRAAVKQQYGQRARLPYKAAPPPWLNAVRREGAEQTVTVAVTIRKPTARGSKRGTPTGAAPGDE
ncbi:MAG: hypothetical protein EXR75_03665 [Myxococcales bacterium]|nr:hypothetical protein [Myxococcales bacterium]